MLSCWQRQAYTKETLLVKLVCVLWGSGVCLMMSVSAQRQCHMPSVRMRAQWIEAEAAD